MRESATTAAKTPAALLKTLPPEHRKVLSAVRKVIRENLPAGYREQVLQGMINYVIPLERYPDTYNREPLSLACIARQKHHYAIYLMCAYLDPELDRWFRAEYRKTGHKLDMGRSCLRFQSLDTVALDVVGKLIAQTTIPRYVRGYEAARRK